MVSPLEQLRSAIRLLSAMAEGQRRYLIEVGQITNFQAADEATSVDELGLQFEDATYLVPQLVQDDVLSAKAVEHIENLNNIMLSLSGEKNADFWTIKALYEDPRWAKIRTLACDTLAAMT